VGHAGKGYFSLAESPLVEVADWILSVVSGLALVVAALSAWAAWAANRKSDEANAAADQANEISDKVAKTVEHRYQADYLSWNLHREDWLH
jgi:hypothetical protein